MKGFLFSIEAVSAIVVVIVVLSIFAYSTTLPSEKTNNNQIQTNAIAQQILYFNKNQLPDDPIKLEQYCTKVTYYNYQTKSFAKKDACWWNE